MKTVEELYAEAQATITKLTADASGAQATITKLNADAEASAALLTEAQAKVTELTKNNESLDARPRRTQGPAGRTGRQGHLAHHPDDLAHGSGRGAHQGKRRAQGGDPQCHRQDREARSRSADGGGAGGGILRRGRQTGGGDRKGTERRRTGGQVQSHHRSRLANQFLAQPLGGAAAEAPIPPQQQQVTPRHALDS